MAITGRKPILFCEKHQLSRRPKIRLRNGRATTEYRCFACGKEHSEKFKEYTRDFNFKKHYGISADQYNVLLQKQNGCCAICDIHESKFDRRLAVDHLDMENGIKLVRGLLCALCNKACGLLKENPDIALKAASYIALKGV